MEAKQVVWITGSSRGIGAAIAHAFAAIGAHVIVSGRSREALANVAARIRTEGGSASVVMMDVTSAKSVNAAITKITAKFGPVHVLVNNAGVTSFKKFEQTTLGEFDAILDTNVRGYFLCTQAVLPSMLSAKQGFVINIHSVSAITTFQNSSVYSASKAGSLAMMRGLRAEVRKQGIRVIDVLPGAVETAMWSSGNRERHGSKMMQPDGVAEVVVSLFCQPGGITTDEIIIRPIEGDL
jgi:NADP-dependent 3-hydroxy acid dehydrogenase YdfG